MNRLFFVLFLVPLSVFLGCDNAENVQPRNEDFFIKIYAGVNEGNQVGNDIIETSDGGLLIAGTSYKEEATRLLSDSLELLLIKTDSKGDIEWAFGGHSIGIQKSEATAVIELPNNTYLLGGTVYENSVSRSILLNIDQNGNYIDSAYVYTDSTGINYSNWISKITLGNSGILVSGGTKHPVSGGSISGVDNGFVRLYDLTLNPIVVGIHSIRYFGTDKDDYITGAFEVNDVANKVGVEDIRILVFGSAIEPVTGSDYNFYYLGFNSNFDPTAFGTTTMKGMEGSNEISNSITAYNDDFWQIGYTDISGSQIYLVGWEFKPGADADWQPKPFTSYIPRSNDIEGKGISIQDGSSAVIVCDVELSGDHSEIYLAKLDRNLDIQSPWPKVYGTITSAYSASTVTTLQDGSIVILGTADLEPIKKIVVIKTGPDGQMSF